MKFFKERILPRILGVLVWVVYRSLYATWRFTLVEPPAMKEALKNRKAFILAHWHGDELVLISLSGRYRIATITSTSKDGEIMNTTLKLLGAKTSRGSSTRGAVSALKGLAKLAKLGHNTSFAVDGPKGPIYKVKPGVFELSRLFNSPIYVSGVSCDRAWRFEKSWNKTFLPKPFAKVRVEWHGPRDSITKEQDPRAPELAKLYEDALCAAKNSASKNLLQSSEGC